MSDEAAEAHPGRNPQAPLSVLQQVADAHVMCLPTRQALAFRITFNATVRPAPQEFPFLTNPQRSFMIQKQVKHLPLRQRNEIKAPIARSEAVEAATDRPAPEGAVAVLYDCADPPFGITRAGAKDLKHRSSRGFVFADR